MAVAIAVMLGEITNKLFIKVSQSLMFLPYFISWMVIGAILYALLNAETGMVNQIVRHFGEKAMIIMQNQERGFNFGYCKYMAKLWI